MNLAITLDGDWYDADQNAEPAEPVGGVRNWQSIAYPNDFDAWFNHAGVTNSRRLRSVDAAKAWVMEKIHFAVWLDEARRISAIIGQPSWGVTTSRGNGWVWCADETRQNTDEIYFIVTDRRQAAVFTRGSGFGTWRHTVKKGESAEDRELREAQIRAWATIVAPL